MKRLAGQGHRLAHLLAVSGLARSTYCRLLSRPAHVTRPDLEPLVRRVWERTPNGCGHRQVRMCLVHEFGQRVSAKSGSGSCAAWAFDASYAVPTHGAATTRTGARAAPRYEL